MKELLERLWLMPAEDLTSALSETMDGFITGLGVSAWIVFGAMGLFFLFRMVFLRLRSRWRKHKSKRSLFIWR